MIQKVLKGDSKRRQLKRAPLLSEDECVSDASTAASTGHSPPPAVHDKPNMGLRIRYSFEEDAAVYISCAQRYFRGSFVSARRSAFFSAGKRRPLSNLIECVAVTFRCKKPVYVIALSYLKRLSETKTVDLRSETHDRLLFATVLVACKFFDDLYYTNTYYADSFRIPLEVLNQMERELLKMLQYNLSIDVELYQALNGQFEALRLPVCQHAQRPSFAGNKGLLVPPPLMATANHFGLPCAVSVIASGFHESAKVTRLVQDLQSSLVSRQYGPHRLQTEAEGLCARALNTRARQIHQLQSQFFSLYKPPSH